MLIWPSDTATIAQRKRHIGLSDSALNREYLDNLSTMKSAWTPVSINAEGFVSDGKPVVVHFHSQEPARDIRIWRVGAHIGAAGRGIHDDEHTMAAWKGERPGIFLTAAGLGR